MMLACLAVSPSYPRHGIPPLPELKFAEMQSKTPYTGDRWSYMEAGPKDAPVVVTLHGIGDNAMQWRFQLAGLSDRFRTIAWNAPGYMLSDGFKTETPTCRDYANALNDFFDAIKVSHAHLLANSFGSRVAMCFATYYPKRVSKMILVGPSAARENDTVQRKEEYLELRRAQVAQGGFRFPDLRVRNLLAPEADAETVELASYPMRATNPRGFMQAAYFLAYDDNTPTRLASRINVSLLIINGREDKITPSSNNAEPIHRSIKGSRLELLKGVGHLPHVEAHDEVNKLIREFIG